LIVAMDPGSRGPLQDVLAQTGFAVDVVDSGVAAVSATRHERPDLIVMDLQLRDFPAEEVIRWLRSNPALDSTPVILLSAHAKDAARSDFWGASALLRMPASPAAIARTIRRVLK
jgi:DNA-binding response OmpR family regulator